MFYNQYKTVLISGPCKSGKSTLLDKYIKGLISNNEDIIILDPKMVEFRMYEDHENIEYVCDDVIEYIINTLKTNMESRLNQETKKLYIIVDEYAEVYWNKPCAKVFKWMLKNKKELNIELALATQLSDIFTKKYTDYAEYILKLTR